MLRVSAEADQLVLFGDGMETDAVPLRFGQTARIGLAAKTLRVLH